VGRKFKGFVLNNFQERAAEAILAGKSVLLSAPPGAGKTLVAVCAIREALAAGKRVIYTAPIKALSNQKYRDLRDDPEVEVGIMTGDVTIDPGAPLLIMTTEIFRNTLFEDPRRVQDVAFVIFDEIHYMDDQERGTVWEESIIFAPEEIRFICLSATVSNLEEFGRWIASIRRHELAVIHSARRPVPLHHRFFHPDAGPFTLEQIPQAKRKVLNSRARGRAPRGGRESHHAAGTALLDHLEQEHLLPVLFFCVSRKECEIKADKNARRRRLLKGEEAKRVEELFDRICRLYQLDWQADPDLRDLRGRALRGIGYHHAGMLPIHKEIVERLFTSGMLKMLFTTETFALGINMPARTVAFNQIRKFDGTSVDYLRTREYLQRAGRAGRQGIDDEGLVYAILEAEDLAGAPLARIVKGRVEPILSHFNLSYSTVLNLYARLGPRLTQAYERSFAYFLAMGKSRRHRDKVRQELIGSIVRKVHTLREAGYLDDDGLLGRGRLASRINGYEIQITELLFSGALDLLGLEDLGALFASIVYEERRGDGPSREGQGLPKEARLLAEQAIHRFQALELSHGIKEPIKPPNFDIVPAAAAWGRGADFKELERYTSVTPGDLVRVFRMTIQMLRQLRKTLQGDYPLRDRLAEAIVCLNRDVVDARRQLELG